ncbi:MAG: alpha/beta hydrolase-fold protein, partial [Vicinamibacterales bacterium]
MREPLRWLAVGLLAIGAWGCGTGEPRSFRELVRTVERVAEDERGTAIEAYIRAHGGTPLVENQSRVIFPVRDRDGVTPRIVGDFNNWAAGPGGQGQDPAAGTPTRIPGTDWSYLEASIYTNARAEYVLLFPNETAVDPLNPRTVQSAAGPRSEVLMPQWIAQPELDAAGAVPAGTVVEETVTSRVLGGTRRVWFYTPPGYDATEDWYPVLYVLDGGNYVGRMEVPAVLDRLIARK